MAFVCISVYRIGRTGSFLAMTEKKIEQIDNDRLEAKLTEILQTWPLYREFKYSGASLQHLPDEIKYFCDQCDKEQTWRQPTLRPQRQADRAGFQQRMFRCLNCKAQMLYFAYEWSNKTEQRDGKSVPYFLFRKYGQVPMLEEKISHELEEALKGTDDLKFYKKALRLRNFDNAIGAMAYMRRVIESHMGEMLEILNEEARSKGLQPLSKEEIAALKFSQKVERAKELFPAIIKPENYPNPFEQLYKLTSDALHNLSEDESILLFDQCRTVFEYVFSELRPHLKKKKKFLEDLQKLPQLGSAAKKKDSAA